MNYSDMTEGNYIAKLSDWGVKEAAGKPMLFLKFDVAVSGELLSFYFEKWFMTKDGKPNKAVQTTLETLEFAGTFDDLINGSSNMNTSKDYYVTVGKERDFWKVLWVSDEASAKKGMQKIDASSLDSNTKAKLNSFFSGKAKKEVKNHAPQKTVKDELSFLD